jgi:hypothetical protein
LFRSKTKRSEIQVYFFAFFTFFHFFRFKFFASLRFGNVCFEAKQSEAKFKSIFSFFAFFHFFCLFFAFFTFFHFFSLNFRFASIFSLNFRLFYLRFRFRFLVFRIEVNHVKSGIFFAYKQNEIFASISNFASEAKVRAHPSTNSLFERQKCCDFFLLALGAPRWGKLSVTLPPPSVPAVKKNIGKVLKETMLLALRWSWFETPPPPPFPAGQTASLVTFLTSILVFLLSVLKRGLILKRTRKLG